MHGNKDCQIYICRSALTRLGCGIARTVQRTWTFSLSWAVRALSRTVLRWSPRTSVVSRSPRIARSVARMVWSVSGATVIVLVRIVARCRCIAQSSCKIKIAYLLPSISNIFTWFWSWVDWRMAPWRRILWGGSSVSWSDTRGPIGRVSGVVGSSPRGVVGCDAQVPGWWILGWIMRSWKCVIIIVIVVASMRGSSFVQISLIDLMRAFFLGSTIIGRRFFATIEGAWFVHWGHGGGIAPVHFSRRFKAWPITRRSEGWWTKRRRT